MIKFKGELAERLLSDCSGELIENPATLEKDNKALDIDSSELNYSPKGNLHGSMSMHNYSSIEYRISTILAKFVQTTSQNFPYEDSLSLRDSLGLESLALVSVILGIGDEFEVDVTDFAMELNSIATVGDLYSLSYKLQSLSYPMPRDEAV